MITISSELELKQLFLKDGVCFKISENSCIDFRDVIHTAINRENYVLRQYNKIETVKTTPITSVPSLDDILLSRYDIPEEVEKEFDSLLKELLNKYNISDKSIKIEYQLVEEYDIRPFIKSVMESRLSTRPHYADKLKRMERM